MIKVLPLMLIFSMSAFSKVTLTWGIENELTPIIKKAKVLKEQIYKHTQGRVNLELRMYDQENESPEAIKAVANRYDIHQLEVSHYYNDHNFLRFWDIPFLFHSREHAESYLNSENAQKILKDIEIKGRTNLSYTYAGGFLYLFSQSKVSNFKKLEGMSCENDGDGKDFLHSFLKPKGINGVFGGGKSYECAEILSSDLSTIFSEMEKGTYKYLNVSRHRILPRVLSVSNNKFNQLTKEDREYVSEQLKKVALEERKSVYDGESFIIKTLKDRGLNVYEWSNKQKELSINYFKKERKSFLNRLDKRAHMEVKKIKELL